ncbi:hypothetical protein EOW66_01235 [Sinirhodobacter huangdaonensis]|uniref:Uncharacterized protein n=1 Tax=Paenirhodobacter huangdaonensis TaxID=2501515 RepID=A0A443LZN1_9RHOB|nr:hypothetical protein EOW66_01235 [Sinirhodobacter huangdaonensis]
MARSPPAWLLRSSRKSAKPRKPDPPGAVARTEFLRTSTDVGRTIWRRWGDYRGNAGARYEEDEKTIRGIVFPDAGMHGFKLLGQRFSARLFDRQLAEIRGQVAVLTGFTALGSPITEVVQYVRSGKGQARSAAGFHRGRWHDFEERGHGLFAMRILAAERHQGRVRRDRIGDLPEAIAGGNPLDRMDRNASGDFRRLPLRGGLTAPDPIRLLRPLSVRQASPLPADGDGFQAFVH